MGRNSRSNSINDSRWRYSLDDSRGCHPLHDAQCYALDDSWRFDTNGTEGDGNGNALSSPARSDDAGADAGFPMGERD